MMRTTAVILLVCLAATSFAAEDGCETKGLWGENCNNVCIGCLPGAGCSKNTGACNADSDGNFCATGYKQASDKQCEPVCFGKQGKDAGCDNGGECVAPNYCICGKSGAQVVGVLRNVTLASGDIVEGTQCVSLRKDGIKGAFISLVVMVIAIGFCGIIEVQRNKGKSRKE